MAAKKKPPGTRTTTGGTHYRGSIPEGSSQRKITLRDEDWAEFGRLLELEGRGENRSGRIRQLVAVEMDRLRGRFSK